MVAVITSALPSANGTEAFTFAIVANDTAKANLVEIQKWQTEAKKFGLKTLRAIGIEKNNYNADATNKDIFKACEQILNNAIATAPKGVRGIIFQGDFADPEDVMELLKLDHTFLDKF
ncbi:hypothetical protein AA0472_0766 [Acetobacter estunensis NRIC 0472]|uniref:Uncharacterized protein n=1 Tax=Acetobacter estunensis TaxID=104097 RepID=A0A967EEQ5_9PROT|nr:hypothetical protein [Acetobacter estunensis]NHO55315.1 hypothetical protein [Acetobacter estunensis]GBQ22425.1 hypothetical protein AA0472_0766 [Acetobacter estunensis NRIC 0472]